jgi:hypothetical protein
MATPRVLRPGLRANIREEVNETPTRSCVREPRNDAAEAGAPRPTVALRRRVADAAIEQVGYPLG